MRHSRTFTLTRSCIFALVAITMLSSLAAYAATVQSLLPANNTVKGWTILPDSLQYGKGKDLTKIYNGGYEVYTDNGVVEAARQMYQRGNDYIEVTIHTMKSDKVALSFLKYWQKQNKVKTLSKSKASTYFTFVKPNTAVYFATGKYFATVSAFHPPDKAKKDVAAIMDTIERNISKR